ncbi:MAG: type II secretion system protein GspL, partial [Burkholderiales bacterium]
MALVVIHLPPRPRLHPARAQTPATQAQESVAELEFVYSADGTALTERGTAAPALLPGLRSSATQVVAVLGEAALSWHRVTLPRAPAARLRLALTGLLEDELLDEPQALHLALEPGARAGTPCWVAVADRPWLAEQLAVLETAGIEVDRIVPVAPPQSPGHAHLESQDESIDAYAQTTIAGLSLSITWAHADGVLQLPLSGSAAPELMPQPLPEGSRVTATPTAALEAERWFGERVPILSTAERWLEATRSDWNLRQFELAPRHRGAAALRSAWQDFRSPAWRTARWGLAALVVLQLVGLNAWAWHQQRDLQATREAMTTLLRNAH